MTQIVAIICDRFPLRWNALNRVVNEPLASRVFLVSPPLYPPFNPTLPVKHVVVPRNAIFTEYLNTLFKLLEQSEFDLLTIVDQIVEPDADYFQIIQANTDNSVPRIYSGKVIKKYSRWDDLMRVTADRYPEQTLVQVPYDQQGNGIYIHQFPGRWCFTLNERAVRMIQQLPLKGSIYPGKVGMELKNRAEKLGGNYRFNPALICTPGDDRFQEMATPQPY